MLFSEFFQRSSPLCSIDTGSLITSMREPLLPVQEVHQNLEIQGYHESTQKSPFHVSGSYYFIIRTVTSA